MNKTIQWFRTMKEEAEEEKKEKRIQALLEEKKRKEKIISGAPAPEIVFEKISEFSQWLNYEYVDFIFFLKTAEGVKIPLSKNRSISAGMAEKILEANGLQIGIRNGKAFLIK